MLLSLCFAALAADPVPADWQKAEAACLKNIKQLTHDFVRAGEAYFHPDGKKIVFQAEVKGDNPFYQIYVMDLPSGKYWRVSPGIGRTTCAFFHPHGQKLIFASSHLDPEAKKHQAAEFKQREEDAKKGIRRRYQWDFDPFMDIFECDLAGDNLKQLTNAKGYDAEGAFGLQPGSKIAFCSNRDGHLHIYTMDEDGKNVKKITTADNCYNGGPFISPDGKRIIFRADRKVKDELQIFVIDIDGKNERQLTDFKGVAWGPYWHPDAKHIIYSAADHADPTVRPNYDLWLMNVDTGKKWRITHAPGADVLPVFSPDGKRLMWTSTRDGKLPGAQVFIADFEMPKE
jgi:Tol biopolymer transport system component